MIVYVVFSIPRAKQELCYIGDGEVFENRCYDDIMEQIRYSQIGCNCFKNLFINFSRTIEVLVSIFYNYI